MDFSQDERNPGKKFTGLAVVIFLHVFIIYALLTGLARKVVEVIKQPVETKIIEEVKPPPPPDLPPPPPPPKMMAPPPPFIPPPEVMVSTPQTPNPISDGTYVKPDSNVLQVVRKTDTATGVRVPAVVDFKVCDKPEYPSKSLRDEEEGTTTLQFLIGVDGHVIDSKVEKSSGFKGLDNAAKLALSRCKFRPGTVDGQPEQSWTKVQYVWKLD